MMMEELTPPINPPIPVEPASQGSPSSRHIASRYTCRRGIQPGQAHVLGCVCQSYFAFWRVEPPFDAIGWLVAWTDVRNSDAGCRVFWSHACHHVSVRGMSGRLEIP
jgi:hypothetical protein